MIQLKLTLDKRRIKKDNTYPLVYRIGANRKSFYLSTGASILEKFWDDKRQQIKLKSKELEMLAECDLDIELNLSLITSEVLYNIYNGFKRAKQQVFPMNLLMRDAMISDTKILKALKVK